MDDPSPQAHKVLQDELGNRISIETTFIEVFADHMKAVKAGTYPLATKKEDFICYRSLIAAYEEACGRSEYAFKFYGAFLAQCDAMKRASGAAQPDGIGVVRERLSKACGKEQEPKA